MQEKNDFQSTLNSIKSGFDNATAAAGRWAGRAIGTLLGGVGGIIGGKVGDLIGRNIRKITQYILAYFAAQMAISFGLVVITLVGLVFFTAFALFIINSGAYIVPPGQLLFGPGEGPGTGPGIAVGASCPIPNGVILCGSYGSTNQVGCIGGHGSNNYWSGQVPRNYTGPHGPDTNGMCRWALPSTRANCYFNQIPGNVCNQSQAPNPIPDGYGWTGEACPYYGWAVDVSYPNFQADLPVYLPYIEGESVIWTSSPGGCRNTGCYGTLRTNFQGDIYEMFMTHLTDRPRGGASGGVAGYLFNLRSVGFGTPHVHIELRINGEQVIPDPMCGNNL